MDVPNELLWTPSDSAGIDQFLGSKLGRKWLSFLFNKKPKIDLSSTEKAALTGAFAAGFESFLNEIAYSRAVVPQSEPSPKGIDPTRD